MHLGKTHCLLSGPVFSRKLMHASLHHPFRVATKSIGQTGNFPRPRIGMGCKSQLSWLAAALTTFERNDDSRTRGGLVVDLGRSQAVENKTDAKAVRLNLNLVHRLAQPSGPCSRLG